MGGADVIEGDPVVGEITGVLTSKADESGGVAYEVRRFTAPTTFISPLSTIHVNVLVNGGQDAVSDATDDDAADSASAALPETGASRTLSRFWRRASTSPSPDSSLWARRPFEVFVPVPRARRPRVNWE